MKLTKKLEAEIRKLYEVYWNSYINGDLETYASLLDEEFKFIGSTEAEPLLNKKDSIKLLDAVKEQMAGKAEFRNRNIKVELIDELILVSELCDGYILIGTEWNFYSRFRLSSLLKKKRNKWKFIHQHVSMPDSKAQEGEAYGLEQIRTENIQLRDAVKRRTVELENKNRELEIETALERVRAVAMAMRKPEDLPGIGETLFKELKSLGFTELRNTEIIIISDVKETLTSYYYSDYGVTGVVEVDYKSNPKVQSWVNQLKKANDAFAEVVITEKEIKAWRKYREEVGHLPDPKLNKAKKVYYYSYSIGMGGLSISTFKPAFNEQIKILERFRNVFNLSYQRYIDIAQAEAQAKEARIETALERIRARALAMHSSNELMEVAKVLREQLSLLGQPDLETSVVHLYEEDPDHILSWRAFRSGTGNEITYGHIAIPKNSCEFVQEWLTNYYSNSIEYTIEISGAKQKEWYDVLFKFAPDVINAMRQNKSIHEKRYHQFSKFSGGALLMVSRQRPSEESIYLQRRAALVFDLAYRRFLDLKKAEAQAREAQIELGLERVRARAMAMQKSGELSELVDTVFKELTKLDFALTWCIINIIDESSMSNTVWAANPDINKAPESYHMLFEDYPYHHAILKDWRERKTKSVYTLEGDEKRIYDDYLFSETEFKRTPEIAQAASRAMEKYVCSFSFCNFGGLQTVGNVPLSDANLDILSRFGKVFDLTYTRFNDLKQAEEQARESQIQLAMERVRARTMAMQKSDELAEAASLLFTQIADLGTNSWSSGFIIFQPDELSINSWMSKPDGSMGVPFNIPVTEDPFFIKIYEAYKRGEEFFIMESSGKELEETYKYMFSLPGAAKALGAIEDLGFQMPTFQITHCVFFPTGFLMFITYEPCKEMWEIFKRFGKVFEQTYTRFLDLQKAEEQAREAQIQLAMERVRARTMAMHSSSELIETAELLFDQMNQLGAESAGVAFAICEPDNIMVKKWTSIGVFSVPYTFEAGEQNMYEAWKNQIEIYEEIYEGDRLKKYLELFMEIPEFRTGFQKFIETGVPVPTWQKNHAIIFKYGYLLLITSKPFKETHIFKRFAKVFEQTYTRFLDLQKAEAQAREAKIEAAMERIRARAMAMHSSDELMEVANVLREQMGILDQPELETSALLIYHDDLETWDSWYAFRPTNDPEGKIKNGIASFTKNSCELTREIVAMYHSSATDYTLDVSGAKRDEWLEVLMKTAPEIAQNAISTETVVFDTTYFHFSDFNGGSLLTVSYLPPSAEIKSLQRRAASVFDLAYRRFLDLKKAEAQAREAQIETALERVRSRSMGMQKSDELKEVIQVVYEQFVHLNIHVEHTGFIMDYKTREDMHIWLADKHVVPFQVTIPYFDCAHWNSFIEAKQKGKNFFANHLSFEEKNKFYQDLFKLIPGVPEETLEYYFNCPGLAISTVLLENVGLYIENFSGTPYSDEENNTLMRFGKVFQQTYTRFLDLQKAEAQTREAKIEAALEKVRSRTMAMQKSEELGDVATVLFKELNSLVKDLWTCGFVLCEKNRAEDEWWLSTESGFIPAFYLPNVGDVTHHNIYQGWLNGEEYHTEQLEGEVLQEHYDWLMTIPIAKKIFDDLAVAGIARPQWQKLHCAYFSKGYLCIITQVPCPEEQIFKRFAQVFDLTYTRFLDLQKAEAQAREAKIEAALEKVRSRTMAMHKSDELAEVATVMFDQMSLLDNTPDRFNIRIANESEGAFEFWATDQEGHLVNKFFRAGFDESPVVLEMYSSWKAKEKILIQDLYGEQLSEWVHYIKDILGVPFDLRHLKEHRFLSSVFFSHGMIGITTNNSPHPETLQLIERFAKVFEQTYTRFLDLQKAEAQTREAKIEAALEKVRSRTMAMQHSDELKEAALLLFQQVQTFGVDQWACGYNIWEADGKTCMAWMSRQGILQPPFKTHPEVDPCFQRFYDAKQRGESFYVEEIGGDEIKTHYERLLSLPELKSAPQEFFDEFIVPAFQIFHIAYFDQGYLMFITYKPVPKTWDIFKRFAKVFEQTYTRFLDLQKAEAQAREAIKQASVDRIRAEIASMRTTNDLERIQPIIWNELTTLGVPFTRCGVFILDEEHEQVDTFLSTPEGKSIASFTSNYSDVAVISEALPYWRKKEIYKAHWDEATFLAQAQTLLSQGNITSAENYLTEHRPKDLYLHFLPFLQGILYVGNETPLHDDELQLVQNLADAFSIAYARYEDFNKLEIAKEQIENTLVDLKQTQAQLVQSEKMASLGELTAGIAHEIQNPLNFVNNFSDVNKELLVEMKDEIEKGNIEEVKAIANDIIGNEEKINHHGKRADAIVKGMLQHSRSSSGVKDPTDINVLADEYLRLAYHGLRAKDKFFNATMKTEFDQSIGKINIVPQDIGRSVLNLISNAFYAVTEKKKQNGEGYEPTVTVTTKKINGKVEIRVADNGNGIPQKVLDKIFQPFFTTKPTGQGTGLGLSLSYDIIKAHGGEINVETKEGEGSDFYIFLPANN